MKIAPEMKSWLRPCTLLNLFARPWYWDLTRKTLKRETVHNLNLVKNYQVSNRKCS